MTFDPWDPPLLPSARETGPAARWHDWWLSREVDPVARAQGFVLVTGQLGAAGVSRSAGRHGVRTGRFTAAGRGVLGMVDIADDDADDHLVRRRRHALAAAAAARLRPDHVVSGRSAAILHGLPTMSVPQQPELTARRPTGNGRRNGTHVFRASIAEDECSDWFGVPVACVARTIVDQARHRRRDGIMAVDAALYQELADVAEVERALARAAGWPGVRKAREVLALGSPLAESPLESITRLAMFDDGFPEPVLQHPVGAYRIDLALLDQRLLIEVDGQIKYQSAPDEPDSNPLWREKRREHSVRRPGWSVERIIWEDIVASWSSTSRRLWRAAERDGPVPNPEPWRLLWPLNARA